MNGWRQDVAFRQHYGINIELTVANRSALMQGNSGFQDTIDHYIFIATGY